MEDIYRETVTAIENGANFRIDFQSRSLKVNGRHMIRNGRYDGAPWLPEYGCGDFFTDVEELYRRYKHSIPSERSQSKSRRYFMALPESDLEDGDMLYGQHRDTAQFELEFYILCRIIVRYDLKSFAAFLAVKLSFRDVCSTFRAFHMNPSILSVF